MAATALTDKQHNRFRQLWLQWHKTHVCQDFATQALSSAVNIHGRLQDLSDSEVFPQVTQQQLELPQEAEQPQQDLQWLVTTKQLVALDKALSLLRQQNDQLQQVVRDLERLYIEVSRCLSLSGSALTAAAVPQGPEPSLLHIVETMQDTWVMCRDELLLKVAILGLVSLDASQQHMATLLQCYRDQPNIERSKTDALLAILQETRQQEQQL